MNNMIAIQSLGFNNRPVRNYLVSKEQANVMCIHSWVKFDRLTKESVEKEIHFAKYRERFIAVSYHKDGENNDCYESYVSVERSIELIEDPTLFVFKFNVLSEAESSEYKMYSIH